MPVMLRRWLCSTVFLVPLLLLAVGAVRRVQGIFAFLNTNARLAGTLSAEASRLLGREVRVQDVQISGNLWNLASKNVIRLKSVSLEDDTGTGTSFVTAKEIVVAYNLNGVLRPPRPDLPLIDSLDLIEPAAFIRRDLKGRFNFDTLLKKLLETKGTGGRALTDRATLTNGSLVYTDARLPAPHGVASRPFSTRMTAVNGIVNIRPDKSAAFEVTGNGVQETLKNFHLSGVYENKPTRITASLEAQGVQLTALGDRLIPPMEGRVVSGTANVSTTAFYAPKGANLLASFRPEALSLHSTVHLDRLSGTIRKVPEPISISTADVEIGDTEVTASFSLEAAGAKVQVSSETSQLPWASFFRPQGWKTLKPILDASGSVSVSDLDRLRRLLTFVDVRRFPPDVQRQLNGLRGSMEAKFAAHGTREHPSLTLRALSPLLAFPNGRLESLHLNADLRDRTLLASVSAKTLKGELNAEGIYRDGAYTAKAQIRGVELGSLPSSLLQHLPKNVNLAGLSGKVALDAEAQGSGKTPPRGTAQIVLKEVTLNRERLHSVYAALESNAKVAVVKKLRVEDERGYLVATGIVGLKDKTLNLNVAASEVDAEAVLNTTQNLLPRLAPKAKLALRDYPLDGVVYLRGQSGPAARITGTWDNPKAEGKVTVFNVLAGKLELDKAEAAFDLSRERLIVSEATVVRAPGFAALSGVITDPFSKEPDLSATATVDSLDLNYLLFEAGVQAEGLQVTGTVSTEKPILITGTTRAPRLREPAQFVLERASFNGVPVRSAAASADFSNNVLTLNAASADLLKGHLAASGTITTHGNLNLSSSVQGIDLAELDSLLPEAIALFNGTVGAEVRVTGTAKKPDVSAVLKGENLRFSSYSLGHLSGSVELQNRVAAVKNLVVEDATLPGTPKRSFNVAHLTYNLDSHQLSGEGSWTGITQDRIGSLIQAALDADASNAYFRDQLGGLAAQVAPLTAFGTALPAYIALQQNSRDPLQMLRTALKYTSSIQTNIAGNFTLSGTDKEPRIGVNWDDIPIRVAGFDLTLKKNSAVVTKASVEAPQIELSAADGDLVARNTRVQFGGEIHSDIDGYNINLAPIVNLMKPPDDPTFGAYDVAGTGTLGISLRGKTASPEIEQASINLADLVISRRSAAAASGPAQAVEASEAERLLKINRINLNNITLKKGVIGTDDIQISVNNTVVRGNAKISKFTWSPPFLEEDAPISITANLLPKNAEDRNLQELASLVPGLLGRQSEGVVTLKTQVEGTRANPFASLNGSLELAASRLQLSSNPVVPKSADLQTAPLSRKTAEDALSTGLKDVDAKIVFNGDVMQVDHFTATSRAFDSRSSLNPAKPNLKIAGSLPLSERARVRHPEAAGITLEAKDLYLEERRIPIVGAGTLSALANVTLKVSNTLESPVLSGVTAVTNARIALPSTLGVSASVGGKRSFNPIFDHLRLVLGKNVRITNALLDTQVTGEAALDGSLSDPRLVGNLALTGGKLTVTNTRLTIRQPSTLTLAYPVYSQGEPTLGLNVNLRAEGTIPIKSGFGGTTRDRVSIQVIGPVTGEVVDPTTNQSRLQILSNDPRIDQATLFRTLALGDPDAFDALGKNPGSVLAERLTNVFTGAVLPRFFDSAAESLGFEELALGYDPVQNFNLNLTRRLFGPFFVSYQRSLSSVRDQYTFRLSVRFSPRFQTSYELNETNEQRVLVEGVFRF